MIRYSGYISSDCHTTPHFAFIKLTVHMAEAFFPSNGGMHDNGDLASATPAGFMGGDGQDARWCGNQPQGQPSQSPSSSYDVAGSDGQGRLPNKFAWSPATTGLIVDVEGFQLKQDFYVKEMAFVNPHTKDYWVGTFKPPYSRQAMKKKYVQDMDWSTRNMHGLKWEEGLYPYNVAFTILTHFGNNCQLLAKGRQKCLWIQQHTSLPVIDLEELGCPPAKELPFGSFCTFHNSLHKSCALDKSMRLGHYVMDMFAMKPATTIVLPVKSDEPI